MRPPQWKRAFTFFLVCFILENIAGFLAMIIWSSACVAGGEITISYIIFCFLLFPIILCDFIFFIAMLFLNTLGLDPMGVMYNFVAGALCITAFIALLPIFFVLCGAYGQFLQLLAGCLAIAAGVLHIINAFWCMQHIPMEEKEWPVRRDRPKQVRRERIPQKKSDTVLKPRKSIEKRPSQESIDERKPLEKQPSSTERKKKVKLKERKPICKLNCRKKKRDRLSQPRSSPVQREQQPTTSHAVTKPFATKRKITPEKPKEVKKVKRKRGACCPFCYKKPKQKRSSKRKRTKAERECKYESDESLHKSKRKCCGSKRKSRSRQSTPSITSQSSNESCRERSATFSADLCKRLKAHVRKLRPSSAANDKCKREQPKEKKARKKPSYKIPKHVPSKRENASKSKRKKSPPTVSPKPTEKPKPRRKCCKSKRDKCERTPSTSLVGRLNTNARQLCNKFDRWHKSPENPKDKRKSRSRERKTSKKRKSSKPTPSPAAASTSKKECKDDKDSKRKRKLAEPRKTPKSKSPSPAPSTSKKGSEDGKNKKRRRSKDPPPAATPVCNINCKQMRDKLRWRSLSVIPDPRKRHCCRSRERKPMEQRKKVKPSPSPAPPPPPPPSTPTPKPKSRSQSRAAKRECKDGPSSSRAALNINCKNMWDKFSKWSKPLAAPVTRKRHCCRSRERPVERQRRPTTRSTPSPAATAATTKSKAKGKAKSKKEC